MFELKPPARPRSEVQTISRWYWSEPVPASSFGLSGPIVTLETMLETTAAMRSAKGRAASAAIIFIARVIFWVDLTEAIRILSVLRVATFGQSLRKGLREIADRGLSEAGGFVVERLGVADLAEQGAVFRAHVAQQAALEAGHGVDRHRVEEAVDAGEDRNDLLLDRHRRILRLLEQLGQARAAVEQALGRGVEVGAELGEGGHFAILGQLQLDRSGDLLHRLGLRGRADAADRETDVDCRADALEEQFGLEEDLAVGDRDDVGRDIGRNVAGLGLDDRQRGQRAVAVGVVHLGGALEQAAVQVEDVAGI